MRTDTQKEQVMTLDTLSIPQADKVWDVARVPEAITKGAVTPAALGAYLGEKGPRQGLYYAQAARILGLVADETINGELVLTPHGRAFMHADRTNQRRTLRSLMFRYEPMRSAIAALREGDGMDLNGIARLLQGLAPLSDSTARRRAQTIGLWLRDLGLVARKDGRLTYCGPRLADAPTPQAIARPSTVGWA